MHNTGTMYYYSTMDPLDVTSGLLSYNSTMLYNKTVESNSTFTNSTVGEIGRKCNHSVHDITTLKPLRLCTLYLIIIIGTIGGLLLFLWMACNKRLSPRFNHLSRVNSFILNLAFADLFVIFLAVLPQLIWEYVDRAWVAGEAMCKIVKFLQSFSMMSSNYILVVIAIDRHQAIRAPLKESIAVWKMAGTGWFVAALLSVPMFGIFHTNVVDGVTRCENIFRTRPMWHRQAFLTYIAIAVFFIPLVILIVCYVRIFTKIAQKALQSSRSRKESLRPGKVHLQSTHSSSLPKAKIKTLKMTFVIIMVFIVCSLPYFIVEMILSYGDHCLVSPGLYSILGGMAAANSAANPFVFLSFNANLNWIKEIKQCGAKQRSPQRAYLYSSASTGTHYTAHRNSAHVYHPNFKDNIDKYELYAMNRKPSMDCV